MKKSIVYIFYSIIAIAIVIIGFVLIKQSFINSKLQQCPNEWIDNQMPSVGPKKLERQYFILNGERREIDEFDMEWIQKNCNLKKQKVF